MYEKYKEKGVFLSSFLCSGHIFLLVSFLLFVIVVFILNLRVHGTMFLPIFHAYINLLIKRIQFVLLTVPIGICIYILNKLLFLITRGHKLMI